MDRHPEQTPIMSAEEIVSKLRAGIDETYEIEMRGTAIYVRVLSGDEFNYIRKACIQQVAAQGGDDTDKNFEIQKAVLAKCCMLKDNVPGILNQKVLARLTVDEITNLYEQYLSILEQVNPTLDTISADEFEAIVTALQKKTSTARELSIRQLRGICSDLPGVLRILEREKSPPANSSGS